MGLRDHPGGGTFFFGSDPMFPPAIETWERLRHQNSPSRVTAGPFLRPAPPTDAESPSAQHVSEDSRGLKRTPASAGQVEENACNPL